MAPILVLADWLIYDSAQLPAQGWGVAIEGTHVIGVGAHADLRVTYPDATVHNAHGQIVAPGFVNAHTHLYGVLAHGIPPAAQVLDFWGFLSNYWWPQVEDRLDHAMLGAAADYACSEMLRSGVTSFFDVLEAPNVLPGGLTVQAERVRRWGLRAVLTFEATQRVSHENGMRGLAENITFIDMQRDLSAHSINNLITGALCFHTTFTCDDAFIQRAFALGTESDVLVHFHCSEGRYEPDHCLKRYGKRTLEHYADLGVLSGRALASQCVQISPHEVELLAEHGVRVTSMPLSNCEVGGGFAPLPEMDRAGVPLGLGTDGYVNNYFALMRGAYLMHKARLQDPTIMPADRVWHMATEGGAHAIGLEKVGALKPGYAADLIAIDADLPTLLTAHNLREQVILWRDPEHIRTVMVAGQWRAQVSDPAELRAHTREQAARLWGVSPKAS